MEAGPGGPEGLYKGGHHARETKSMEALQSIMWWPVGWNQMVGLG